MNVDRRSHTCTDILNGLRRNRSIRSARSERTSGWSFKYRADGDLKIPRQMERRFMHRRAFCRILNARPFARNLFENFAFSIKERRAASEERREGGRGGGEEKKKRLIQSISDLPSRQQTSIARFREQLRELAYKRQKVITRGLKVGKILAEYRRRQFVASRATQHLCDLYARDVGERDLTLRRNLRSSSFDPEGTKYFRARRDDHDDLPGCAFGCTSVSSDRRRVSRGECPLWAKEALQSAGPRT